jgi:hypothetical protein
VLVYIGVSGLVYIGVSGLVYIGVSVYSGLVYRYIGVVIVGSIIVSIIVIHVTYTLTRIQLSARNSEVSSRSVLMIWISVESYILR